MAGLMGAAPPGLAGWLLADEARRAQQGAQMQRFQGLLGAEQTINNMEEQQRVRGLMQQFPQALASGSEQQILGLIGQMDPKALLPYMLAKADNPVVGTENVVTPEGPRIFNRLKRGDYVNTGLQPHQNTGAGSQQERALTILEGLAKKHRDGETITSDDLLRGQSAEAILRQRRHAVDPATGRLYATEPMTIPTELLGWKPGTAPAVPGAAAPGAAPVPVNALPDPAAGGGRRALDANTEKAFKTMGEGAKMLGDLRAGFKDDFGGFVSDLAGNAVIQWGRRAPESLQNETGSNKQDMALWWQKYEQWITDIRAEKFGLTLTGNELNAMEKYRVSPKDNPTIIKRNLDEQWKIVQAAMGRQLNAVRVSGQNEAEARAHLGLPTNPLQEQLRVQPDVQAARDQERNRILAAEGQPGGGGLLPSSTVLAPGSAPAGGNMSALPPPAQHKGRTVEDVSTGKKYKSDGMRWVEQ